MCNCTDMMIYFNNTLGYITKAKYDLWCILIILLFDFIFLKINCFSTNVLQISSHFSFMLLCEDFQQNFYEID